MSDIVKRLREMAEADYYGRDQPHFVSPEECADEIERLQEALRAIAESGEYTTGDGHAKCIAIARAAVKTKP